ncbi:hypothetical protein [Exiguobacterium sp. s163]|uniref:hypothetical protein n=1 Tax=Exiguobacterium sp. s163 TaxID=2751287 RepID=UPI001BEA2AA5|nr:hypothetical protein [Exiguobacterium sp. s163]
MPNEKYELAYETMTMFEIDNVERKMYRIRALRDIPEHGVKKGDFGGWVEDESTLSMTSSAWIFDDAKVCENSYVIDNATVRHYAKVYGLSAICGNSKIEHDSSVFDSHVQGTVTMRGKCIVNNSIVQGGDITMTGFIEIENSTIFGDNVVIAGGPVIKNSQMFIFDGTIKDVVRIESCTIGARKNEVENLSVLENARLETLSLHAEKVTIGGYALLSGKMNLKACSINDFVSISTSTDELNLSHTQLNGDMRIDDDNADHIEQMYRIPLRHS